MFDEHTTLREIVTNYPQTRSVFEHFGLDYCCGGGRELKMALDAKNISSEVFFPKLKEAIQSPSMAGYDRDWKKATLTELVDYIETVHHGFMKKNLPEIKDLIIKVSEVHSVKHGKILAYLNLVFDSFWEEIWQHLLKEEEILFPYIRQLEAYAHGKGEKPVPPYGTVQNIIRHMERYEHANAGQTMLDIREYTDNYKLPEDACQSFKALYDIFKALEQDLYKHIHLENNILFPKTIELEQKSQII